MDQETFNKYLLRAFEDEEILAAFSRVIQSSRKEKDSKEVRKFRRDMAAWAEKATTHDVSRTTIQNGIYAAIRLKTGIRSMNGLTDDALPQAKTVFETFKKEFG